MLEYGPNKLLISLFNQKHLIKCEGLTTFTEVEAPEQANDKKNSIQLMPDFHENDFPHFFVTGASQIWLGNLVENKMETLIIGSSKPYYSNPGVIFLGTKDTDVTRFIFSSLFINKSNFAQY